MKTEFALAFNEITERFGLSAETVMEALEYLWDQGEYIAFRANCREFTCGSCAMIIDGKPQLDDQGKPVRMFVGATFKEGTFPEFLEKAPDPKTGEKTFLAGSAGGQATGTKRRILPHGVGLEDPHGVAASQDR